MKGLGHFPMSENPDAFHEAPATGAGEDRQALILTAVSGVQASVREGAVCVLFAEPRRQGSSCSEARTLAIVALP